MRAHYICGPFEVGEGGGGVGVVELFAALGFLENVPFLDIVCKCVPVIIDATGVA